MVPSHLRARLRYRFDSTMSRGAIALVAYLAVAAVLLVLVGASLYALVVGGHASFAQRIWAALGRAIDSGTFTGDSGWSLRIISLLVTLGGIFLVSALIGLIATALDQRLEELRKGRSTVIERGHTLILGWAPTLPAILSELSVANENQKDACVVVMARESKVEMEDALRRRIPRGSSTRLVCRSGDPADPSDLEIASPMEARSVIVLAEPGESPDAQTVKVVLALMSFDIGFEHLNVTAELVDPRHAEALEASTAGRVRTVVSTELIARVTALLCHQTGLSAVVQDLLDFDGDEIYFRQEGALTGRTVAEARLAYRDATVIGVRHGDGRVELNPAGEDVIGADASLVTIAEDDDRFTLVERSTGHRNGAPGPRAEPARVPVRTLVIGWNELGPEILRELDAVAGAGSQVRVLADPDHVAAGVLAAPPGLSQISCRFEEGDTTSGATLRTVLAREHYDRIVLLCYRAALTTEEADALTLLTLLQVRRLTDAEGHPNRAASIVTELLDVRAVRLARVANPDDFVVSERLTSLMLAQLSENPELDGVFGELFGSGGCELRMRPASTYLNGAVAVTFAEAIEAAGALGETAIGLSTAAGSAINPAKDARLGAGDSLIVLR